MEEKKYTLKSLGQAVELLQAKNIDIQVVLGNIEGKIDKLTQIMEKHIKHTQEEIRTLKVSITNNAQNFDLRLGLLEKVDYSLRDKPKKKFN